MAQCICWSSQPIVSCATGIASIATWTDKRETMINAEWKGGRLRRTARHFRGYFTMKLVHICLWAKVWVLYISNINFDLLSPGEVWFTGNRVTMHYRGTETVSEAWLPPAVSRWRSTVHTSRKRANATIVLNGANLHIYRMEMTSESFCNTCFQWCLCSRSRIQRHDVPSPHESPSLQSSLCVNLNKCDNRGTVGGSCWWSKEYCDPM